MDVQDRREVEPLFQVEVVDFEAKELVGEYYTTYESCMTRIRAVGDVISKGNKPKNLHVAIESMQQGVYTMRRLHNQAGPLLSAESHWCCNQPKSVAMRGGVQVFDWTIALTAIGLSVGGLSQEDETDKTMSALRSIAILGVGAMHVVQGWFSGKTFEQIASEDDLFTLMKGSARKIRYVESMIQTFTAWQTLQAHEGVNGDSNLSENVNSLIDTLEAIPIKPKEQGGQCRRDILEAFLKTAMGKRMKGQSRKLESYIRLVEEEYTERTTSLETEDNGIDSEDVMKPTETFPTPDPKQLSLRRIKRSPSTGSLSITKLDEFVQSRCCFLVNWNIDSLVRKIQSKYSTVEIESAAVGGALKKHAATEIDFQTSIQSLQEILPEIEKLERVAKYILDSESKIPTSASFRAQQQYRTIIQLLLTVGAFATSTVETAQEFNKDKPDQTLKTVAFAALILGQIGARWDNKLQSNIFSKMRKQQILRGVLSRKYSATTKALIEYWKGCQKALNGGDDFDVERAFVTRVPKPIQGAFTIDDVAQNIIQNRKKTTSVIIEGEPFSARRLLRVDHAMTDSITGADIIDERGLPTTGVSDYGQAYEAAERRTRPDLIRLSEASALGECYQSQVEERTFHESDEERYNQAVELMEDSRSPVEASCSRWEEDEHARADLATHHNVSSRREQWFLADEVIPESDSDIVAHAPAVPLTFIRVEEERERLPEDEVGVASRKEWQVRLESQTNKEDLAREEQAWKEQTEYELASCTQQSSLSQVSFRQSDQSAGELGVVKSIPIAARGLSEWSDSSDDSNTDWRIQNQKTEFEQRVHELAEKAKAASERQAPKTTVEEPLRVEERAEMCITTATFDSPATCDDFGSNEYEAQRMAPLQAQQVQIRPEVQNPWDAYDSHDEDVPVGDWELRLRQIDKRRRKRINEPVRTEMPIDDKDLLEIQVSNTKTGATDTTTSRRQISMV